MPFLLSTELVWAAITPFWLSSDDENKCMIIEDEGKDDDNEDRDDDDDGDNIVTEVKENSNILK